ncbi:MAG TPA: NADH-quinone oxidoreductase subunit M [Polyangiaceae bacterium LLY-WYZ-15_(1-7)]|nr:Fe-S-binding domain-containing protein [Myxococcales bacterium]MAT27864.1 Fe-S-binding domain-containing protein [Sandaracinus sp.]HJK93590.1 NADH-quinone oxidoreductase subunit M [Polyangiaceae bacterium LLY-WYZ-15_(1-7)]MBJ71743.1 Fe-S-binding domain-containing protein [Sandaracinus sp.]HJL05876.1 NADH-quinone oxidoreductase subunit M [Polyangiaceae bacterium LLY-WYZ-15_(1-7)]
MSAWLSENLLTALLVVPMLGAIGVLFMPRQWPNAIRRFSVAMLTVNFGLSLLLLPDFVELVQYVLGRLPGVEDLTLADYSQQGYLFVVDEPWIESVGISYKLGVDGISLWLVLLTTLLTPIALFASWTSVKTKVKEYALAFLLLEVGMLGAFFALDLFLFYVFWELMLVPMYLIVGVWGGPNRVYAAVKFFLYTMVGSLLMLVAILYLVGSYEELTGFYTFDLVALHDVILPFDAQVLLFLAFAVAFAIKVPMFPFHTWLPDAHVQAPTGGSVILAAVMLKLGTYGLLRFAMPMFPLASQFLGPTIAVLGVIGIVYGAYCAWVQKDVKKLVAYSSVSHMGFIALGMFAMTPQGINGAIIQMVNHGVSTGALFILVGVIYERRHTRDIDEFGGLAKVMPWYAVLFIIVAMSSIGLPGTNGFIGEFMIMNGAFASSFIEGPFDIVGLGRWGVVHTLVAATGVILAALYMLHAVLKMFWGPVSKKENEGLRDMTWREWAAVAPLILFIFWIGVHPTTFLDASAPAVDNFISDFRTKFAESRDDSLRLWHPDRHTAPVEEGEEVEAEPAEAAAEAEAPSDGQREAANVLPPSERTLALAAPSHPAPSLNATGENR